MTKSLFKDELKNLDCQIKLISVLIKNLNCII